MGGGGPQNLRQASRSHLFLLLSIAKTAQNFGMLWWGLSFTWGFLEFCDLMGVVEGPRHPPTVETGHWDSTEYTYSWGESVFE